MKILAFVDLHGDKEIFEKIKEKAKQVDLILCAGDLTFFENELDYFLNELNKMGKKVLIIPGNHESEENLTELTKNLENVFQIHKGMFVRDEYLILGYGGGGFSMTDSGFYKVGEAFKDKIKDEHKVIFMIHGPPYGTQLDIINGEHVGNRTTRAFINETKPAIVIFGHLHEYGGKEENIGETKLINPGPEGRIIDI
ncbi:metallophosphoesterase family protein [Candidatus Woesearchaeota archaeon]|nr:metallophosphoesterase family protein [Candidatus Woesearchaeota archaeon]